MGWRQGVQQCIFSYPCLKSSQFNLYRLKSQITWPQGASQSVQCSKWKKLSVSLVLCSADIGDRNVRLLLNITNLRLWWFRKRDITVEMIKCTFLRTEDRKNRPTTTIFKRWILWPAIKIVQAQSWNNLQKCRKFKEMLIFDYSSKG